MDLTHKHRILDLRCFFGVKLQSMIGHGLGAAGGLEAVATIKAITTGWLHPTLNQDVQNHDSYFMPQIQ